MPLYAAIKYRLIVKKFKCKDDNLRSFKILNERKFDESVYLIPIKDFVFVKGKSPGAHVAELGKRMGRNPERLVEWCRHD